jgi:hypothetical protein
MELNGNAILVAQKKDERNEPIPDISVAMPPGKAALPQ